MKKMILVSAITTIVIMGITMLMMHLCPICSSCKDDNKCSKDSVELKCDKDKADLDCCKKNKGDRNCGHHGGDVTEHHGCESHGKPKCSMHGENSFHMMDMLKEERAEFDNLLSDEEKAEITRIKEVFAGFDHNEMNSEDIAEKYSEEYASIQAIIDNHDAEIEAVIAKKHENGMPNVDKEKMAEMKVKFKMHFLTMDF